MAMSNVLRVRRVALPAVAVALGALIWVVFGARAGGAQAPPEGLRLAGADRVATAIEVSRYAFPDGADEVYLAGLDATPDALAAGSLTGGPLLLVPRCGTFPQPVVDEIARLAPDRVIALGGDRAVNPDVLRQAVNGEADPAVECPRAGVALVVVDRAADGSSVAIAIRNDTDDRLAYGRQYTLERREDGVWRPLQPGVGPFQADGLYVEPRSTTEPVRIGPTVVRNGEEMPLEPGEYRVSKEAGETEGSPPRRASYSTTFTIDS